LRSALGFAHGIGSAKVTEKWSHPLPGTSSWCYIISSSITVTALATLRIL